MPSDKLIDWNAVRAEYISGSSYRALAEKHGTNKDVIARKAKAEGWIKDRETARDKAATKCIQKVANAAASNADRAERIREKLLVILEREIDNLPQKTGSASFTSAERIEKDKKTGKPIKTRSSKEYKLRDLTAMYKDLTADLITATSETPEDDGFLAALSGSTAEDWADEEG